MTVVAADKLPAQGAVVEFLTNSSLQGTQLAARHSNALSADTASSGDLELLRQDTGATIVVSKAVSDCNECRLSLSGLWSRQSAWKVTTDKDGVTALSVASFTPGTAQFQVSIAGVTVEPQTIDITWTQPAVSPPDNGYHRLVLGACME